MANEIGWGAAYDPETGYGMAAVTGAEIGYGTVVINSYSGETNISSMDADNPRGDEMDILSEPLNITVIEGSIYMYFLLRSDVTPFQMRYTVYKDGDEFITNSTTTDGLQLVADIDMPGASWYVTLSIYTDGTNEFMYQSNVLTV
jgi:hypothetical protein